MCPSSTPLLLLGHSTGCDPHFCFLIIGKCLQASSQEVGSEAEICLQGNFLRMLSGITKVREGGGRQNWAVGEAELGYGSRGLGRCHGDC